MTHANSHHLVLSIYPTSRGYAFVLFEGPESPYDWGVKDIRNKRKNEATLKGIRALIERYHPNHLIIEDYTDPASRRSSRIRSFYRMVINLAESQRIEVSSFSHDAILMCFASVGAKTKYEIAQAIAQHIPALAHRLPRLRRIWMSEDPRQSMFDAAALGVVFYAAQNMNILS